MKAVYIDEPGRISMREDPMPEITSPDDVIIRIRYAGICGSDVHVYEGKNAFVTYPRVFGHEFAGEVHAFGEAVTGLQAGDHVVGEPIDYCGECYPCRQGHPNVCEHLQVYGIHKNGGCQHYLKMPASRVHRIDHSVPWTMAVLTEPLTIGFRVCNRAEVGPDDLVLVQGAGVIGSCALLAAKARGARVIATDLFEEKLAFSRRLGADYTINAGEQNVEEEVLRISGGRGANVILDTVGTSKSLESAIDLASAAGRIVEIGMGAITSPVSHMKMCRRDLTLMGTRLQACEFPEAIAFVEQNWQRLGEFVTDVCSMEQVEQAFERILTNPAEVRKILVEIS
ncbi:MAG: zinc-binding alcohol dehydrogenase family protein [Oscillospiraceae bacterium]|nr:zinc-binding alcohol dehydrogenase family protein [Oscillospiraceae bacterium]